MRIRQIIRFENWNKNNNNKKRYYKKKSIKVFKIFKNENHLELN